MFEDLSRRLGKTFNKMMGRTRLKEEQIEDGLREVRKALIEADVASLVVNDFIEAIKAKAIGQEITQNLSAAQVFIKIVNDELTRILGESQSGLNLNAPAPIVILVAGLQGAGKTTTTAKLALWLKEKLKKKVMIASTDIYRPAAIEQLKILASQAEVAFFETSETKPENIAKTALQQAKTQFQDILIIDTAGRLHIDTEMMTEIKNLHSVLNPTETLFVVDSMTGQDAANTAKSFHEHLPLTGVILTKTEGDARGGAALSIRTITGKPIKFIGTGEKITALEPFYPDRQASRILGMGDVLSLIEDIESKVDKEKTEKLAKKLEKGQGFDLEDMRNQMKEMSKLGGMSSMLDKLPGMGAIPEALKSKVNDKVIVHAVAVLDSMTPHERKHPAVIANSGSRKRRIAVGAGVTLQEVNRVLKQHEQMQKMMKKFSMKGGLQNLMRGLPGQFPPGMFPTG